jgi:hypothetical protein
MWPFRSALKRASDSIAHVRFMVSSANALIVKSNQAIFMTLNKTCEVSISTELPEILYTDFRDMLALSFTGASHYYNRSTDGSTSTGNLNTLRMNS